MSSKQKISVAPDVVSQGIANDTDLLRLNDIRYLDLDDVDTRIWQLIQ